MIPHGKQEITGADVQTVAEVFRLDSLIQGAAVPVFEAAVAGYVGAEHAVAVNSVTSALHFARRALGLKPGETVWTSPITFVASANCALHCGASVDFVDIDPATFNISVFALEAKLERASAQKVCGETAKAKPTTKFSRRKVDEYEALQAEIEAIKAEMNSASGG